MSDEIRDLLQTINSSWLSKKPGELSKILADCFHADMVIKGCDLETVAEGRDACVGSYVDFIQQAKISAFRQDEADIRVVGDTAIASYGWKITYTLEGKEYTEPGHDVFVFNRTNGKWLAIWRAMLTEIGRTIFTLRARAPARSQRASEQDEERCRALFLRERRRLRDIRRRR